MSLRHAILGFLADEPRSGYDLKKSFDSQLAFFWKADQAQIYRTLDALEREGGVISELVEQRARPDRRVHSLSPMGRQELVEWLASDQAGAQTKDPFLMSVFFGRYIPKETRIQALRRERERHQERLAAYRAIPLPKAREARTERDQQARFTLDLGIAMEEAWLRWVEQVLDVMDQ